MTDADIKTDTYVRCGHTGCNWVISLIDLGEYDVDRLMTMFREHCIKQHDLNPQESGRLVFHDLRTHTLMLVGR